MITLLASIAGFITSIIPEIIKLLKDKHDKKHELEILDRQMQFSAISKQNTLEEIAITKDMMEHISLYSTYNSGINWVDALNGSVRPVLAYSFFIMYLMIKIMQYRFLDNNSMLVQYIDIIWDVDDQAIFAGIISFYFGQRGFSRGKKHR
jgi:hypothetical protein